MPELKNTTYIFKLGPLEIWEQCVTCTASALSNHPGIYFKYAVPDQFYRWSQSNGQKNVYPLANLVAAIIRCGGILDW